jgi:hypothetical protein
MAKMLPVPHSPFPVPSASEVLTTTDPEEVRGHIGFTYATVFQDDQLVPGFALTLFNRGEEGLGTDRATATSHSQLPLADTSPSASPTPSTTSRSVYDSWVQLKVPLSSNTTFRRAFQVRSHPSSSLLAYFRLVSH